MSCEPITKMRSSGDACRCSSWSRSRYTGACTSVFREHRTNVRWSCWRSDTVSAVCCVTAEGGKNRLRISEVWGFIADKSFSKIERKSYPHSQVPWLYTNPRILKRRKKCPASIYRAGFNRTPNKNRLPLPRQHERGFSSRHREASILTKWRSI